VVRKALAYITRQGAQGLEILVFEHWNGPQPGTQLPGGTVDPGEELVDALHREIEEETGLVGCRVMRMLAQVEFYADWRNEWQMRHVFHLLAPDNAPDSWTHVVSAGEEDKGLVFTLKWLSLEEAGSKLKWGQAQWLHLLEQ
jgi:ADP-ribose pyrophosphatase YjhB (NUDIX family)